MKMFNLEFFSRLIMVVLFIGVLAVGAQADAYIHWENASGKLGALTYGSQWNYTDTYGGGATESSLNQRVTSIVSVDENNNSGVSYADSAFYAESISDTLSTNGRGGLVQDTQDGGWGKLQILGKADSSRAGTDIRTYTEATADAYVTFSIHSEEKRTAPVLVKFTVEFASVATDGYTGDLNIYRDRDPVADTADRFCNFATFGGLAQDGRPAGHFVLEEDENTQILYDINGNPVDHMFDDPSRPDQYDALVPDALYGYPDSGRGGLIPGEYLVPYADNTVDMLSDRTMLYNDDGDDYVDGNEMQEALLQTSLAVDPGNHANDPLYTDRMEGANTMAMEYSRGNVTYSEGLESYVTYFWVDPEDFDDPMAIYVQLSANLAVDGGIEGDFGSTDGSDQLSTMFYNVQIVPEPGTIILIGSALVGIAGIMRKKLF